MSMLVLEVTDKTLVKNIESSTSIKNIKITDLIGFRKCVRDNLKKDILDLLNKSDFEGLKSLFEGAYNLPNLKIFLPESEHELTDVSSYYIQKLYDLNLLNDFIKKTPFEIKQDFKEKAFKFFLLKKFQEKHSSLTNGLLLYYISKYNKTWFSFIQRPKIAIIDTSIVYTNATIIKINTYLKTVNNIVQLDKEDMDRINNEFKEIQKAYKKELLNRNSDIHYKRFFDQPFNKCGIEEFAKGE